MFREEKNVKDIKSPLSDIPFNKEEGQGWSLSYTKTNKLIAALYMVTDIIDKNEPLRNKLRTLGIGIIEDINFTPWNIRSKISELMSFLDIAYGINIISSMNCNILRREFSLLDQSIKEAVGDIKSPKREINLSDFLRDSPLPKYPLGRDGNFPSPEGLSFGLGTKLRSGVREKLSTQTSGHHSREEVNSKGHYSIGHRYPTRLGVQKGSTLMKALSDNIGIGLRSQGLGSSYIQNFEILKKQRRNDIINIIKTIGGNVTIKDIKDRAQSLPTEVVALASCGEKTLQRELVLMVKDNVLNKMGEKRWSRYFLK